jgi:CO/xanthine dehydrogenase FAD-binding subunit
MSFWQHYYLAHSVSDALQALVTAGGSARLIAGGTDLLLDLQQGRLSPIDTLVDINGVMEMTIIEIRSDSLYIGAALPLNQLVSSPLVQEHAQALVEACGLVGGPQVRNSATLGGNVAHALPAADGSIALMALDAQAEIANQDGSRTVPLSELYLGPGCSALQAGRELIVGFILPLIASGQASAFSRVMRPQGVALPILNMAAWLWRKQDRIAGLRLAVGPAGPTPQRSHLVEEAMLGHSLTAETLELAAQVLLSEAHFRTSPHRSSAQYRQHLSGVLLRQVLSTAWERAGKTT